ncbi:hypothetical protein J2S30_002851 [Herbaspirillum rubrisubalbicans]|uniref:hypothetical protein n=1 Tax=Herbaspirillum rubrisubalbicans TaxID=80842 RepID=UPI0020A02870|nr:hypothetical protein [Herbaspirillum rubrisubalbicans]MCP1574472.1 hypothetical protein [Herbaspirillum rubrisubalbicans]
MDVKDFLVTDYLTTDDVIEVTGWLVDQNEGLFLLGEHYPEDFDFPIKVRISKSNVIYPILSVVPELGGGRSSLFYRAKIVGKKNKSNELEIEHIYIQTDRTKDEFQEVDVSDVLVAEFVRKFGDYNFRHSRDPMGDWLDDFI